MRTWQLYLDESGDFEKLEAPILIAGVLFEGRATYELSSRLRRRIEDIFVGSAYPPHAAHHNIAASLLCGALLGKEAQGPSRKRFLGGIRPALDIAKGNGPQARALRAGLAQVEPGQLPPFEPLRAFDAWLHASDPKAYRMLQQERDLQRGDLAEFASNDLPKVIRHPPLVVAAWQAEAGLLRDANARYEQLYEVLLERALAFVARRDEEAHLQVHLGARPPVNLQAHYARLTEAQDRARQFPLFRRVNSPLEIIRYNPEAYRSRVAPGIVLADFAANTLQRALFSVTPWASLEADFRGSTGLSVAAKSALLSFPTALPSVAVDGRTREAIRRAAERSAHDGPAPSLAAEPRWAREQAEAWIAAVQGEPAP